MYSLDVALAKIYTRYLFGIEYYKGRKYIRGAETGETLFMKEIGIVTHTNCSLFIKTCFFLFRFQLSHCQYKQSLTKRSYQK